MKPSNGLEVRPWLIAAGIVLINGLAGSPPIAGADDFQKKTKFWAQLNAPMTAIVDGLPLREALSRICEPVELNFFLDRQVDPTSPVVVGSSVGPTIFVALDLIVQQRDCVVMPVANVVLVGRANWVDATAASLLNVSATPSTDSLVDVSWPEPSTPREAFAAALGLSAAKTESVALPHDLWPSVSWKQIDRSVALSLVLAQFDLQLEGPFELPNLAWKAKPISVKGSFERTYSSDSKSSLVHRLAQAHDPQSRTLKDNDRLLVRATPLAHRLITRELLKEFAKTVAAREPEEEKRFSLNRTQASAATALHQFARAAGRQCIIEPDAVEACQRRIELEAKDETLRSLIDRVARQVGVVVHWHSDKIVVTVAP